MSTLPNPQNIPFTQIVAAPTASVPVAPAHGTRFFSLRIGPDPLGVMSVIAGLLGTALMCVGDPYWMALPLGAVAIGLGWLVLRRFDPEHPGAHVGCILGWLTVLLWLGLDIVLGVLAGIHVSVFTL